MGLKPSAMQGKARLRGLYRSNCSKTIISVAAWGARIRECSTSSIGFNLCDNCYDPVCRTIRGAMEIERLIRHAPLAVGLKPSAIQGEARLRGLWRIMYSKTISPRLSRAKPACAGYTETTINPDPCAIERFGLDANEILFVCTIGQLRTSPLTDLF